MPTSVAGQLMMVSSERDMKQPLIILIIAAFMSLAFSCKSAAASPHKKPTMTKADVVAIANAEASRQGYDLEEYETPRAEYEFTANDQTWSVFYEGKEKVPGNHFLIIINDRTGNCQLMRGE